MSSDDLVDPNRDRADRDSGPEYPKIADEENLSQRRTHERVAAIQDDIVNVQAQAAKDFDGEYSPADYRQATHQLVKQLWKELRPTLASATADTEKYYWSKIKLGEFTVSPPAILREPQDRVEASQQPDLQPGGSWAKPQKYTIQGFQQFCRQDTRIRTRWEVRLDDSQINTDVLRQYIQRADPDGTYQVWERTGLDHREPFKVDKITLLPEYVIDNARGALKELSEKAGHGFGKPDHVDKQEDRKV